MLHAKRRSPRPAFCIPVVPDLTDRARDYLAEHGYDPSYGARPLKRIIQRELETALGRKLLSGEIRDGSRVTVNAGNQGLEFSSSATANGATATAS